MLAYTYVDKGKFEHLTGQAEAGPAGRTGCYRPGDAGEYLHQRSPYQAWQRSPRRTRHHSGP